MKLNFDKGVLVPQINDEVARIPLERTRDQAKKGGFDERATKPLPLITDFNKLAREHGILVLDQVIKPDHVAQLRKDLTSKDFPWSISEGRVHPDDGDYYFVHLAKNCINLNDAGEKDYQIQKENQTFAYEYVYNLVLPLAIHLVARMQFNLNMPSSEVVPDEWHTDFNYEYAKDHQLTAVFFITDSDGPLNFFNIGSVECKANRVAIFPTGTVHAGSSHTTKGPRISINLNYYPYSYLPVFERTKNND